jgi:hypothetical protein
VNSYPTPALDFLRKVQVWQQAPGGTAGIAVFMPDAEETTLEGLLAQAAQVPQQRALLETRARTWLVGYREMNPPLTRAQAAELDAIITQTAEPQPRTPRPAPRTRPREPLLPRRALIVLAALAFAIGLITAGVWHVLSESSGPAASPAASQPLPTAFAPQQAPPAADTVLQQFEHDWGIPAVAQPSAGSPRALVLLNSNGLYYPSPWTVPASDPAWSLDPGGHVVLPVRVAGGRVTFTDGNGISWTVGVAQPFTEASDPGTVLEIDQAGDILAMPEDHAVAVRHRV